MATFRMVHTEFWNDPKVIEDMTPEDKYFFLYLLTNPNTTQVGIYQITKKQMAFDMGYSIETINSLLDRFINHHKLIKYNPQTREIAIKNWGKYNLRRGGKPMLDCVSSELKEVKDTSLISYVSANVENKSIREIYESFNVTCDDTCNDTYNDTSDESNSDFSKNEKNNSINGSHDTSTIRGTYRPQYKEQEQEEDKEKDKEQELLEDPSVKEITRFWDENGFGRDNVNAKQLLLSWLDDSPFLEPKEMILKAMSIACARNKRYLSYVEGILKNWVKDSTLTLKEVEIRENQRGETNENSGPSYELPPKQDGDVRLFK